jgi:hypothetical protein
LCGEKGCETAGLSVVGQNQRRAARHFVEFRPVGRVGHNELGLAAAFGSDAMLNGCRTERREQRLIDSADPPSAQHRNEQFGDARQQPRDHIAAADAKRT